MTKNTEVITKVPGRIIGTCGEHYVAAYLSRLGLLVAIPRGGTSRFDLLVSKEEGGRALHLQVKTGTKPTGGTKATGPIYLWRTDERVLKWNDRNLWYAFVNLTDWPDGKGIPEVFFVPSKVVVRCINDCISDKEQPWFWLYKDNARNYNGAEKYRGAVGLRPLLRAMNT